MLFTCPSGDSQADRQKDIQSVCVLPDHTQSQPPIDSAEWRTVVGHPPPHACSLSDSLQGCCNLVVPQTQMLKFHLHGMSLRYSHIHTAYQTVFQCYFWDCGELIELE